MEKVPVLEMIGYSSTIVGPRVFIQFRKHSLIVVVCLHPNTVSWRSSIIYTAKWISNMNAPCHTKDTALQACPVTDDK